MALLDRLRARPAWQHPDAVIRASAVRQLDSSHQELFTSIAKTDADAHVRRVAAAKLVEVAALADVAASDADPGVRGEAASRLSQIAIEESDEGRALQASTALADPRAVLLVAKTARLGAVRRHALERVSDPRALATIAKNAEDGALRLDALGRIADLEIVAEVALKSQSKDVAVAAVERVVDRDALRLVAEKGKNKAAVRRAAVRLSGLRAQDSVPPPPSDATEEDLRKYEEARATLVREAEEAEAARRGRMALVERAERLKGEAAAEGLPALRAEWVALPALASEEADSLQRQFDAACGRAQARFEALGPSQERRVAMEALCVEAEEAASTGEPADAKKKLADLRAAWPVFEEFDDWAPGLRERFAKAEEEVARRTALSREEHDKQVEANRQRLVAIIERVEALAKAETIALKDAGVALKDTKDALDQTGPLASKKDREEIVARLKAARAALYPRVQDLREADDWTRWANVAKQEEIIAKMEGLKEMTASDKLVREYRSLQEAWKEFSKVPKDQAQPLWQRFKAARDSVSGRVKEFLVVRKTEWTENLKKKEALCESAEALSASTDWVKTAQELQKLQAEWKKVGPVSRKHSEKIWQRFRKACDAFFARRKDDLDARRGEWDKNLHAKEALCEQAEALAESTEWEKSSAEVRRLQAEWKTIGPVKRSRSEALWNRFRKACDTFFDRYKKRDQIAGDARGAEAEALLAELQGAVPGEGESAGADVPAKVQDVANRWKALIAKGPIPREIVDRYFEARAKVVAASPQAFAGTDLDPQAARQRAEKLCAKVEALLPKETAAAGSVESIAEKLQRALAGSAIGGRAEVEARKRAALEEVKSAQAAFKRIGPLPPPDGDLLAKRFRAACDRFFATARSE